MAPYTQASTNPAPEDGDRTKLAFLANPQVLIPFIRQEAISVSQAAVIAGRSESTIRAWAANYHIGRRIGRGHWNISRAALHMLLNSADAALVAYLSGDRESELVACHYRAAGVPLPRKPALANGETR